VLDLLPSFNVPPGGDVPAKGVFCDNAMDIVLEHYPKPDKARKTEFIKAAMSDLNKYGIVGMHDAGVVPGDLELYEELANHPDCQSQCHDRMRCAQHVLS
jgi:predicted amidohydrolase YtcJ